MQFNYGVFSTLNILDETKFWKLQETEHAMMLRQVVVNLEDTFMILLENWESALKTTHEHVKRFAESVVPRHLNQTSQLHQQTLELVSFSLQESEAFIQFFQKLKDESQALVYNQPAIIALDHMINESAHFVGVAQTFLYDTE